MNAESKKLVKEDGNLFLDESRQFVSFLAIRITARKSWDTDESPKTFVPFRMRFSFDSKNVILKDHRVETYIVRLNLALKARRRQQKRIYVYTDGVKKT